MNAIVAGADRRRPVGAEGEARQSGPSGHRPSDDFIRLTRNPDLPSPNIWQPLQKPKVYHEFNHKGQLVEVSQ